MTEPTLKPFLSAVARAESFNYLQAKARAKRLRNAPPRRAESSVHVAALSPVEGIVVCNHAIVVVDAALAASCVEFGTLPEGHLFIVNEALAALADRREDAPGVDLASLRRVPNANHTNNKAPRPHIVPAIDAYADSAFPRAFDNDGDRFVCDLPKLPPFRAAPLLMAAYDVCGYSTAYMLAIDAAIGGATHAEIGEINGMMCLFLYGPSGMGLVVPARISVASPASPAA